MARQPPLPNLHFPSLASVCRVLFHSSASFPFLPSFAPKCNSRHFRRPSVFLSPHIVPAFLSFLDYLTRCEILPTRVELSVSSVSQRHRSTVVQFIPGSRVATSNSSSSVQFFIGFLLLISSFLNGIDGSHHHVHAKNLKIEWPSEERETWEI